MLDYEIQYEMLGWLWNTVWNARLNQSCTGCVKSQRSARVEQRVPNATSVSVIVSRQFTREVGINKGSTGISDESTVSKYSHSRRFDESTVSSDQSTLIAVGLIQYFHLVRRITVSGRRCARSACGPHVVSCISTFECCTCNIPRRASREDDKREPTGSFGFWVLDVHDSLVAEFYLVDRRQGKVI